MNTSKSINSIQHARHTFGIRGRIFLGFISIAVILISTTVFINSKIRTSANFAHEIVANEFPTINAYLDLNGYVYGTYAALSNYIVTRDDKFKKTFLAEWQEINDTIILIDNHSKSWENSDLSNSWQSAKSLIKDIYATESKLINTASTINAADLSHVLTNELQPMVDRLLDILDGPIQDNGSREGGIYNKIYNQWDTKAEKSAEDLRQVNNLQYILLVSYILAAIVIAVITARSILNPLNNAIDIAKKIASGERDIKIHVASKDETGELLFALDSMLKSITTNEKKLQENEAHTRVLFENIVKTAGNYSQHSARVAKGDLTQRLTLEGNHEMAQLGDDLNQMTDNLSTIAQRITESCHNMVSNLEEVKQSIEVQSTGATEQASSINEITASLEEIEKSSAQTIEKAKALGEVAEKTRENGQLGLDAIGQSIQGMKSIREKVQTIAQTILDLSNQTQQVGEITNVVNSLAQQSKMLALNASIEAAKAGEAGKGFAVVAAEVKSLAEQSEHSTAQVQKILEDIRHATEKAVMATEEGTKGVDQGTALVEQTGSIVRSLTDVIHETTIASEQIAAAIRQEGVGIEQITAGMNEINQVTASFVASVRQTTKAIDGLSSLTKNLKQHVDIYKI
jgi:methyl-accepting chemotaxis protein